jgi:hypothetical protein
LVRVLAIQIDVVELNVFQLLGDPVAPEEGICRTFIVIVGEQAGIDLRPLSPARCIADGRK